MAKSRPSKFHTVTIMEVRVQLPVGSDPDDYEDARSSVDALWVDDALDAHTNDDATLPLNIRFVVKQTGGDRWA